MPPRRKRPVSDKSDAPRVVCLFFDLHGDFRMTRRKSAPDQDPAENQFTALIYFAKFARGGVPVGADRDPDKEPIPPVLSIPSSR